MDLQLSHRRFCYVVISQHTKQSVAQHTRWSKEQIIQTIQAGGADISLLLEPPAVVIKPRRSAKPKKAAVDDDEDAVAKADDVSALEELKQELDGAATTIQVLTQLHAHTRHSHSSITSLPQLHTCSYASHSPVTQPHSRTVTQLHGHSRARRCSFFLR
jgi:hypothetical protein